MTYDQLTEAQQKRACIIWEGEYGADPDCWNDAVQDALIREADEKQDNKATDELPDWLR